jgi:hypothetical protein
MTPSTRQHLLIALCSVLVGCAVGATMPSLSAQSFPPNPNAPRWVQFCEELRDDSTANRRIEARGDRGFELVSMVFRHDTSDLAPADNMWVCFKRPYAQ